MTSHTRGFLVVTLAAGAFLMVTMGVRQSFGLFISPLNSSTGLGIATISFALAIGQFTWGAVQPIAGALADRLKKMEEAGLVAAKPYQERPVRYAYTLTKKGHDLKHVLAAVARWGKKHIRGTRIPPEFRA